MKRIFSLCFFIVILLVPCLDASTQKVEQIMDTLSRKTGLPVPEGLTIRFETAERLEDVFFEDFLKNHPRENLKKESHFLRLIGVFGNEKDIETLFRTMAKGNIKAFYQSGTRTLHIDQSIPFEDDYSMGPLIAEIRIAMCEPNRVLAPPRGFFFTDKNWLYFSLLHGDASFVMHQFYREDAAILASMDGMSLITRDPLVSSASYFQREPLLGMFYSRGLIQGVNYAGRLFRKKDWRALNRAQASPLPDLLTFLVEKSEREAVSGPVPSLAQLSGFTELELHRPGLFLMAALMQKNPGTVLSELGWCGDICSVAQDDSGVGEMARWKSAWKDEQASKEAYLILRNGFENRSHCRFTKGIRQGKSFLAGRDDSGCYIFLRHDMENLLLVRSLDRRAMNRFIEMARF